MIRMRKALAAHWRYKAALSVALTLAFCVPYFLLQHVVIFPVRRLPLSLVDLSIPFSPGWVWIYQSVYVLHLDRSVVRGAPPTIFIATRVVFCCRHTSALRSSCCFRSPALDRRPQPAT